MFAPDSITPLPRAENAHAGPGNVPGPQRKSMNSTRLYLLSALTICVVVSLGTVRLRSSSYFGFSGAGGSAVNEDKLDQRLASAATAALGDRRGTVIVMDPQTGRVRAVVNPEIAFEQNLPDRKSVV